MLSMPIANLPPENSELCVLIARHLRMSSKLENSCWIYRSMTSMVHNPLKFFEHHEIGEFLVSWAPKTDILSFASARRVWRSSPTGLDLVLRWKMHSVVWRLGDEKEILIQKWSCSVYICLCQGCSELVANWLCFIETLSDVVPCFNAPKLIGRFPHLLETSSVSVVKSKQSPTQCGWLRYERNFRGRHTDTRYSCIWKNSTSVARKEWNNTSLIAAPHFCLSCAESP